MLTKQDKIEIQEIAREIVESVLAKYNETHIATCPYGRSLLKFTCIAIGIALGSGIIGGGTIAGWLKLTGAF